MFRTNQYERGWRRLLPLLSVFLIGSMLSARASAQAGTDSWPEPGSGQIEGEVKALGPDGLIHAIAGARVELFLQANGTTETLPTTDTLLGNLGDDDGASTETHWIDWTDSEGEFEFEHLPAPAEYLIVVHAQGHESQQRRVKLWPGQELELDFNLVPLGPLPTGSLAGRVTDALTSAPIQGALVCLTPIFWPQIPPPAGVDHGDDDYYDGDRYLHPYDDDDDDHGDDDDYAPIPLRRALTDTSGTYLIEFIPAGRYRVSVRARNYEPQHVDDVEITSDTRSFLNFALLPMPMQQPGAIVGQVLDAATSAPLAGARVHFKRLPQQPGYLDDRSDDEDRDEQLPPEPSDYVLTNEGGFYRIENLPPGRYHLLAEAPGHLPQRKGADVPSGAEVTVDFALAERPGGVGALAGVVVSAVSTDTLATTLDDGATSQPLAGAKVWVVAAGDVTWLTDDDDPACVYGRAITDEQGRFLIDDIPAGPVFVFVKKEGYRKQRVSALIEATTVTELVIRLQPIFQARKGELKGVVRNKANGRPIEHALVTLATSQTVMLSNSPTEPLRAVTDDEGKFRFRRLPVGTYLVTVEHPRFLPERLEAQIVARETTELEILLEPLEAPAYGALGGVAWDEATSQPLAGVTIRLARDSDDELSRNNSITTMTNELGEYFFPRLRPGAWRVAAVKPGYLREQKRVFLRPDEIERVDFRMRPLPGPGAIEGFVTDSLTSEPIVGATVFVPPGGLPMAGLRHEIPHAETDKTGFYRLEGIPSGRRIAVAVEKHYWPDAQLVDVPLSGTARLDFELLPHRSDRRHVRVHCVDRQGRPIFGARVRLAISEWIAPGLPFDPWQVNCDANGEAELTDVPTGAWNISAGRYGYLTSQVAAEITAPPAGAAGRIESQSIVLTLERDPGTNAAGDWQLYQ